MKKTVDFCILGAGPTGLYLAIRLIQSGFRVLVLEKRTEPNSHSRSIGIHPPSLELFENAGIVEEFLQKGNRVLGGDVLSDHAQLGSLRFQTTKPPYQFVLSLPQFETEAILAKHLAKLDSSSIKLGIDSIQITKMKSGFKITNPSYEIDCTYLIDSTGKNSSFRSKLGFDWNLTNYTDTYVLADFKRSSQSDNMASIYLNQDGLVESFPLPNGVQRWVVKTTTFKKEIDTYEFARTIYSKTGHTIDPKTCSLINPFGVQKGIANHLINGNAILCGDAAHIISPIGGQGMNLAWLNAETLVDGLKNGNVNEYEHIAKSRWKKAVFRSEFNMQLGRTLPAWANQIRKLGAKAILSPLFAHKFAEQFTMRGI